MKKFVNLLLATALLVTSIGTTVNAEERLSETKVEGEWREYRDYPFGDFPTEMRTANDIDKIYEVSTYSEELKSNNSNMDSGLIGEWFQLVIRNANEVEKEMQEVDITYNPETKEYEKEGYYLGSRSRKIYWYFVSNDYEGYLNTECMKDLGNANDYYGYAIINNNNIDLYDSDDEAYEPTFLAAHIKYDEYVEKEGERINYDELVRRSLRGHLYNFDDYLVDTTYYIKTYDVDEETSDNLLQASDKCQVIIKNLEDIEKMDEYRFGTDDDILKQRLNDVGKYFISDVNYVIYTIKNPIYNTIHKLSQSIKIYYVLNEEETALYDTILNCQDIYDLSDYAVGEIFRSHGYENADVWAVKPSEFEKWAKEYYGPEEVVEETDYAELENIEDIVINEETGEIIIKNSNGTTVTERINDDGTVTVTTTENESESNSLVTILLIALIVAVAAVIYLLYTKNKRGN